MLHKSSKSSGVETGELEKVCVCPEIREGTPSSLGDAVIELRGTVPMMFSAKVSPRESTFPVYVDHLEACGLAVSFADPRGFELLG